MINVNGINYDEKKKKWIVTFCYEQKKELLGSFDDFQDALEARINKEKEVYSKIDNLIKRQRLLLHKTQEDVANALNVTQVTVSCWENGEIKPSLQNIKKLSKLLKIKYSTLVKYFEDM